jgi:hypothetical protein
MHHILCMAQPRKWTTFPRGCGTWRQSVVLLRLPGSGRLSDFRAGFWSWLEKFVGPEPRLGRMVARVEAWPGLPSAQEFLCCGWAPRALSDGPLVCWACPSDIVGLHGGGTFMGCWAIHSLLDGTASVPNGYISWAPDWFGESIGGLLGLSHASRGHMQVSPQNT